MPIVAPEEAVPLKDGELNADDRTTDDNDGNPNSSPTEEKITSITGNVEVVQESGESCGPGDESVEAKVLKNATSEGEAKVTYVSCVSVGCG